jgi:PAS domain S-box-containing protein
MRQPATTKWSLDSLISEIESLASLGSWEWDVLANRVTWSDELYRIYGLEPATSPATFEAYLDRVHAEDRDATRQAVEKAFREGGSFDHDERIVRNDGSIRILHSCGRALKDASGQVVRMVGTCQDITDCKRVLVALKQSEERYRELAETITEVFWIISPDLQNLYYLSPAFEQVFGVPRRLLEERPKHWLRLVHPEDREGVRAKVNAQVQEGRIDVTCRLLRPDASVRCVRFRGFPVRDASGTIVRITGITEDVTELKETENNLRQAQKRLEEALHRTQDRVVVLEEQVRSRASFVKFVGKSAPMQEVYRRLRLSAQSDVTVLLTGESGTGKELAATAIHSLSDRRSKPFVAVNCSAIPEQLLESELFGHVKGAFTGAVRDKVGLFEAADEGTLFLDEVGDMAPALQVKVLRALEEREFRRVGDERVLKVDVRLIAATNRNLPQLVASGRIRQDFYYRIRVFDLRIPPLRERREDLPLLLQHFLQELAPLGKAAARISPEALRAVLDYAWPGNVRELRNAIEHSVVMSQGREITPADLPAEIREGTAPTWSPQESEERELLRTALERTGWNRTRAAAHLGTSRVTLWKKLRRFQLAPEPVAAIRS